MSLRYAVTPIVNPEDRTARPKYRLRAKIGRHRRHGSKGPDTEAEATAANKEAVRVNYAANSKIRDTVNRFTLEKLKPDRTP
jgi:hypothetical protein